MENSVCSVTMRPVERTAYRNTFYIGIGVMVSTFAYFFYANKMLGARFNCLAINEHKVAI